MIDCRYIYECVCIYLKFLAFMHGMFVKSDCKALGCVFSALFVDVRCLNLYTTMSF